MASTTGVLVAKGLLFPNKGLPPPIYRSTSSFSSQALLLLGCCAKRGTLQLIFRMRWKTWEMRRSGLYIRPLNEMTAAQNHPCFSAQFVDTKYLFEKDMRSTYLSLRSGKIKIFANFVFLLRLSTRNFCSSVTSVISVGFFSSPSFFPPRLFPQVLACSRKECFTGPSPGLGKALRK